MAAADRDFYQVLGVPRNASPEEIQRAYRRLARRNHPDVNSDPGAEERFKEITEAYDTLSNPEHRARYDRFGPSWRQMPEDFEAGGPSRSAGGRPAGGRAGRAGQYGGSRVRVEPGGYGDFEAGFGPGGIDLDDLFGSLFGERGNGRGGFGRGPVRGADTEAEITVSVEEAYTGGTRRVTLSSPAGPRSYKVTIPPGVTDGQRIRLAGQGSSGMDGGPPGDLYLVVRLAPHPRYRVNGRDISVDLPIAPWEGALGATVPVDTPGGPTEVRVPPGTSTGRRLRLAGRGLPNPRGAPGDLYAEVRVMVPSVLSRQERKLFRELAKSSTFDPRLEARARENAAGPSGSAGSGSASSSGPAGSAGSGSASSASAAAGFAAPAGGGSVGPGSAGTSAGRQPVT
jgi:curved DNA-binding protein